jgi:diaminopimelate decarboxylase
MPAALIETQSQTLALAARLADESGAVLPHCNLGGGFGIPYFPGDQARSTSARLALHWVSISPSFPIVCAKPQFCIELGRYLVGEAGVYLTRIVDRKVSHGEVHS